MALANAREAPSPQRHGDVGLSNRLKAGDEEKEALLSIGDDAMGPEEFARAVFHCGDLKTWDGMCPVSQVCLSRNAARGGGLFGEGHAAFQGNRK